MRRALSLLLFLSLLAPSLGQAFETRIFHLNHRLAEATIEMVRPLLSPTGTVVAEARLQKLIVRDSPDKLEEIAAFLQQLDQAAPHVRITVAMHGQSLSQGHLVTLDPSRPELTALASDGRSSAETEQTLIVMSGEHGMITMARDLVTVEPYLRFCQDHALIPSGLFAQSVSTGFAVRPTVVGDVVRLTITPWLSFVGGSGRVEVLADGAATTMALQSGQQATIGEGGSTEDFRGQAFGLIFDSRGQSSGRSSSITVRPEVIDL